MARGNGRRKIPMNLIDDKSTRKTTFKKRKNGLFKKAMELSILTDCKVMVFVFNEKDTDISEYSTVDPTTMMQMYVDQAVLPHEKYTNDDYDTIGLKPAERKRLGLKAPGKREPTLLPPMLESMSNTNHVEQVENPNLAKKKRTKPKEVKKAIKKRRLSDNEEEITSTEYKKEDTPSQDLHTNVNLTTPVVHDADTLSMSDTQPNIYTSLPMDIRNDSSSTGAPIVMPNFMLKDPSKTERLSSVRKHGTFSSPAFRIGLTPSPGGIQTPRSADDTQAMESLNSYFPSGNGIYSPNLDELLQTTPKG